MNIRIKKYTAIIFAALITAFSGVNSVSAEAASNNTPTETPDEPIVEIISTLDEPTIEAVDSPFKKITDIVPLPKPGDVDDDTFITSADSLLILRASIGVINEYTDRLYSGDVDCDKVITSADSLSILRKSAGFDQVFKNEPLTNVQWFKQGDDYYAKSADGEPIRGLVIIDGYRCGFDKKGKLFTKKAYIGGKKYNFLSSGILPEGWQYSSEGKSFYSDGEKLTGLNEIYGLTYYLVNGIAVKGWQTINGLRMYFGDNGAASVGWKTIGGKMFYFDRDYCVKEGLQSIAGDKYYLFSDGDFAKGFKTVDGKRFYFGADGKAAQGLTKIDGNTYYFDYNNIMQTGWQVIDGIRYYLTDKGYAATGEYVIDGLEYHFTDEGKFFTGLQNIFGKTYYFDDFGFSQYGWQLIDNKKYYFKDNGDAAVGTYDIDGTEFRFDSSGVMQNGWINNNGYKSYIAGNEITTGEQIIDGFKYLFNEDGLLITGFYKENGVNCRNNKYGYPIKGNWQYVRIADGTICSELGIDGYEYYKWLVNHDGTLSNDIDNNIDYRDYYIGTPYNGYDHRNPKGDCETAYGVRDKAGVAGMNCTGFVWHVFMKSALNSGKTLDWAEANIPTMHDSFNGKSTNCLSWAGGLLNAHKNIEYYYYDSTKYATLTAAVNAAVDDGIFDYGDVVFLKTSFDCHVGIYTGDGTVNQWWDSGGDNLGCNEWGDKIDLRFGTFNYIYIIKAGCANTNT